MHWAGAKTILGPDAPFALKQIVPHNGIPTDDGYRRFADAEARVLLDWMAGRPTPSFDH